MLDESTPGMPVDGGPGGSVKFLTPSQIARQYPVSRSTLYCACQSGLLAYYRIPSRKGAKGKYLIKEADFLAWLESNRQSGGARCAPPLLPTVTQPQPRPRHIRMKP